MEIRNYKSALNYLEGFIGNVIFKVDKEFIKYHDPLERMRVLLSLLGNPQEKFKSILVGGTSGKGSTAYLISHILTTAGYKTGFTLSPHLQKVNERLQINGKEISDKEFVKLLNSVKPAIEKMEGAPARHRLAKASAGGPSYFEILIGMVFTYFAKEKVDIAVVEVGMGGEFDATNTLNPLVAVLTNVGLDHTNILGKSVSQIARTKAGIIKGLSIKDKGSINHSSLIINHLSVVTGAKQPSVIKIVEDKCKEVGAEVFRLHKDFDFKIKKESLKGTFFDLIIFSDRRKRLNNLELALLGDYQVENASLAVKTVLELKKFGFKITDGNIKKALKTAFFPGRFEVLRLSLDKLGIAQDKTSSTLVLDGAHNPTKMKAFLTSLKKLFPRQKRMFFVGFKFDKDIGKMLKQITKVADKIIITEFNRSTDMAVSASADAKSIKYKVLSIKYKGKVDVEKDSKKALALALNYPITQLPNYQTIIVITGSLYLVGEIRNML